jgi:GTPase SAR1 family protein
MPEEYESTEGVQTSLWSFKGKDGAYVNAHVWDFAGHSITHSAHRCFLSARCLYIYVYNGRIERDNDPIYWLEQIRIHGGDSPVLFLINEKDDYKADIAKKTLKNKYSSIVDYYFVNIGSEDKTKLEEFRQTVMDIVSNNPSWNSQYVSVEAYNIKNKLRERFDKKKSPYITRDEFSNIAMNCGVNDENVENILNDLHILGICLWYNKSELDDFNMLVLNPDWITNGIYKIINQSNEENIHILNTSKGTDILKRNGRYEYPHEKVAYLFKLMGLYELAFFKDTGTIFIPGILPVDMPDELPDFDDPKDRLTMEFRVTEFLPPGITARVMVQRSDEIFNEKLLWRKGAVLRYKNGDTIALIIEESRSITIRVKGTEKTEYIAILRKTIKDIFDDYKGIKPDLLYEVLLPEKSEKDKLPSWYYENKKSLMLLEDVIRGCMQEMLPYFDAPNRRKIPLYKLGTAAHEYGIPINIYGGNWQIGDGNYMDDHSSINNSHDCTVNLQGELNTLARSLQKDDEDAKELLLAAEEIEQVRKLIPENAVEIPVEIKTEVKKKGLLNRLQGIYDDLNDKNSALYKKASKVKRGIEIAQKVAKQYNDIAQWFGLPQVPKPFLGKAE